MASVLNQPYFQDEDAAYEKLESIVWPNSPVCPHCGSTDRMKKMGGTATRPGLYKCYACRKQSRVTVGTVFESSHVKLHMWLQAAYLMCASKKGISSNQLARVLGVTVKTAWFMSHRLREAMAGGALPPMGGEGAVVEIDETFIGSKKEKAEKARGYAHKHAVLTLVERGKGSRSFHVDGTKAADLVPIIKANVLPGTRVMTDEAGQYAHLNRHFSGMISCATARVSMVALGPHEHRRGLLQRVQARHEGHLSALRREAPAPLRGGVRLPVQQPGEAGRGRRAADSKCTARHCRQAADLSAS